MHQLNWALPTGLRSLAFGHPHWRRGAKVKTNGRPAPLWGVWQRSGRVDPTITNHHPVGPKDSRMHHLKASMMPSFKPSWIHLWSSIIPLSSDVIRNTSLFKSTPRFKKDRNLIQEPGYFERPVERKVVGDPGIYEILHIYTYVYIYIYNLYNYIFVFILETLFEWWLSKQTILQHFRKKTAKSVPPPQEQLQKLCSKEGKAEYQDGPPVAKSLPWEKWARVGVILFMADILHQLRWSISQYLHGFIHPKWCGNSSINSRSPQNMKSDRRIHFQASNFQGARNFSFRMF